MNKLIKEEINRIKEVMGLKLLTEGVIPSGSLKLLLKNLLGQGFEESLNKIGSALPTEKTGKTLELIKSLRASTDETVRNLMRSVEEVAIRDYDGLSSELFDDLINGKLSDGVEEEILQKIASKSIGIDPRLMTVLPSDFAEKVRLINKLRNDLVIKDLKKVRATYTADKESYLRLLDQFQKTRAEIKALPGENSLFKRELLNKFDNYTRLFDDVVSGRVTKIVDDSISDDIISDAAKKLTADMESNTPKDLNSIADNSDLNGAIRKSVVQSGLFTGQQNIDNAVKEIRAKLFAQLEPNLKRILTTNENEIESIEKLWVNKGFAESKRQKLLSDAKKELLPLFSYKDRQWWINALTGAVRSTGEVKGKDAVQKFLFRWYNSMKVAAVLALSEMVIRFQTNPKQVEAMPGDNYVEKFVNSIGGVGPIIQAITPWGVGRLINLISGGIGREQLEPTQTQMSDYLKTRGINVIPGNIQLSPPGQDYKSDLYPSEVVASVSNTVTNDNYGLFTYDVETEKIILVQGEEPGSPTKTPTPGTTTTITDFKNYIKSSEGWGDAAPPDKITFEGEEIDAYQETKTGFRVYDSDGSYYDYTFENGKFTNPNL